MKKRIIASDILGESVYEYTLDSGLKLYVFPKSGYNANYAVFGVKFGSVDRAFISKGKTVSVPAGTAHFLEHKMFESEEKDAFERFSRTGASANAYTSFDRTCYLFLCSDGFYDSYDILLDFVQSPYFTPETVSKEQGIIGQEIRMYDDSGDWQVFMNALRGLYVNNPVNIDIAGTSESIAEITADTLYDCYNTFYDPSNMFICISGDLDPDEVADFTKSHLKDKTPSGFLRGEFEEPETVNAPLITCELDVSKPQFILGYKQKVPGNGYYRMCLATELLLDIMASERSPLYKRLLDAGLINSEFSAEICNGRSYFSVMFGGESSDPQKVHAEITAEVARLISEGIPADAFEASRRQLYSATIRGCDSVTGIVRELVNSCVDGNEPFEKFDFYKEVTLDELQKLLTMLFDESKTTMSVVNPKNQ